MDQIAKFAKGTTFGASSDSGENISAAAFRVTRHIATGGAGRVYLCLDLRTGKNVVVKIPLKWENTLDIFAEARWLLGQESLVHTALVRDAGLTPVSNSGLDVPYLVFDRYQGSIGTALEEHGKVSPETAVKWLKQITLALQSSGLIHRDLKPDNILLDENDDAFLADFGLAIPANPYRRRKLGFKVHGLNGTPRYMAPEQIGEDESVDLRADIYALGLIAYELIVGDSARPSKPASMSNDDYLDMLLYEYQIPTQNITHPGMRRFVESCTATLRASRLPDHFSVLEALRLCCQ